MDKPKILTGDELVARGTTKVDVSLPEIGLKDVVPNGSWLEQKQIQSALEARKHLVETERIEKRGVLSQAEWREELMLAEVTQKVGGHWQYVGHNVGRQLFLNPEEALYLMEVNCLQLKYNEVTVSLQQAYSLLLRGKISLYQYKVYASLSRLGYKVFRHDDKPDCDRKTVLVPQNIKTEGNDKAEGVAGCTNVSVEKEVSIKMDVDEDTVSDKASMDVGKETPIQEFVLKKEIRSEGFTEIETVDIKDTSQESMETSGENVSDARENCADIQQATVAEKLAREECFENNLESEKKCDSENVNEKNNSQVSETPMDVNVLLASSTPVNENSLKENNSVSDNNWVVDRKGASPENIENESMDANVDNETTQADSIELRNNQIDDSLPRAPELAKNSVIAIDSEHENAIGRSISESSDAVYIPNNIAQSHRISINSDDVQIIRHNSETERNSVIQIDSENENAFGRFVSEIDIDSESDNARCNTASECSNTNVFRPAENGNLDLTNTSQQSHDNATGYQHSKLHLLENRKVRSCDPQSLKSNFETIPDMYQKQVVTINIPEEQHIPKNVFLNNTSYVLNLDNVKSKAKDLRPPSADQRPYSASEEVNGDHIRRVRDLLNNLPQNTWNVPFRSNPRFPGPNLQYRPFPFWRPRHNMSYINVNMLFQRPFLPSMIFMPRFNVFPRPPLLRPFANTANNPNTNSNNNNEDTSSNPRKRIRDKNKQTHLEAIKRLAMRLKHLIQSGNTRSQNLESLNRLIDTYNIRYRTRLSLSDEFDIFNDEKIVATIELDCEDEPKSKNPRTEVNDKYDENLNTLKRLANKLKDLESKNNASGRHRRTLSSVLKRFNKSYNADLYMSTDYEVLDRKQITLDSSSDSDCIIEETKKTTGKKLRNPFNILKKLSEKQNSSFVIPTTSREGHNTDTLQNKIYSERLQKTFKNAWLPNESDFGRAEVVPRNLMYKHLMGCKHDEYLFEYIRNQTYNFDNWLDIKLTFLRSIEQSTAEYEGEILTEEDACGISPIIGPKDCTDMPSVLKKLRIIKTNKDVSPETNLHIDFNVYNRDVQNFKKSNPPKPHFRVICINESSSFPSGCDVAALHSKYNGDVILFAFVGIGSISYLQINPTDLPVHLPSNDLDLA